MHNPSMDFDQKCPYFFKGDRFSPNFFLYNFDTFIPLESKLTAECQGCLCDVARRREELVRDGDEPVCVGGARGELLERVDPPVGFQHRQLLSLSRLLETSSTTDFNLFGFQVERSACLHIPRSPLLTISMLLINVVQGYIFA